MDVTPYVSQHNVRSNPPPLEAIKLQGDPLLSILMILLELTHT